MIDTNTWIEIIPKGYPPIPRVSMSSILIENDILFFGGYDGSLWNNDLYLFNLSNNKNLIKTFLKIIIYKFYKLNF
jgi:hypothetical protein